MIMDRFRLDGKVTLVTGGSRGIGLAIAEALGEAGAKVYIHGRKHNQAALDALKAKGIEAKFIAADLEAPERAGDIVRELVKAEGRIDILVNNAGISSSGPSETYAVAEWRKLMAVNLDQLFFASQAALLAMQAQGGGVILNIGSISGLVSNIPQKQAAYNASKAAVHMLTKSMASDFATSNIRVNAIAPGYIKTDMTNGGLANPEWAPIWKSMTPMGRAAEPEEVATAALFLCSPASSYVTGEVLVVDGGYTSR